MISNDVIKKTKRLLLYIVDTVTEAKVKYKIHSFESGAVMIDIWLDDNFYIVQIDRNIIGLSLVTKDTAPFNIISDQSFRDVSSFKKAFENIFS